MFRIILLALGLHLLIGVGLGYSVIFVAMDWLNAGPSALLGLPQRWSEETGFVLRQFTDANRMPYAASIVGFVLLLPICAGLWHGALLARGKAVGFIWVMLMVAVLGMVGFVANRLILDYLVVNFGGLTAIAGSLMYFGLTMVGLWVGVYVLISPLVATILNRLQPPTNG